MKFYEDEAYKWEHRGQTKRRYRVECTGNHYTAWAYDAVDAILRVSVRFGWGNNLWNVWVDCETRGDLHASACTGGYGQPRDMYAEVIRNA